MVGFFAGEIMVGLFLFCFNSITNEENVMRELN